MRLEDLADEFLNSRGRAGQPQGGSPLDVKCVAGQHGKKSPFFEFIGMVMVPSFAELVFLLCALWNTKLTKKASNSSTALSLV